MFKKLLAFAVAAVVTVGMAAESLQRPIARRYPQGRGSSESVSQPNLPPNSVLKPDGSWEGMDIEMGQEIAKVLKVEAEFVAANSPQRVPMIVSDQVDIMLGGLTRNFRRALLIDYTLPHVHRVPGRADHGQVGPACRAGGTSTGRTSRWPTFAGSTPAAVDRQQTSRRPRRSCSTAART